VSRAVAYRHADWLSLVEPSGSFVTIPVLNRVFPDGLDRVDSNVRESVRQYLPADFRDVAANTLWTEWVLSELLGWGVRLKSGPSVPAELTHVVAEHHTVLRPDHVLVEPKESGDTPRALVCCWSYGTKMNTKVADDRWAATPIERMALLCRATGVPLGVVTDGAQWQIVWAPRDTAPGSATFLAPLFSEERALVDAFTSLLGAKRFFAVAPNDTIEALLGQSATAQEVVADQLGRQVRSAVELLVASISRANREREGALLNGHSETEIYTAAVTVMMRMVFLLFAEERGLLPLDDDFYSQSYALSTLRESLQTERDLNGDEPLERRSSAWSRLLALFRAVHGGLSHENLRIPPYGGRLFDPDRFAFLEGRAMGESWHDTMSHPIPVDDLTMLAILTRLQILELSEGGVREARQLSYRTLEVEQIGHVYEGLLDHSVRLVTDTTIGLIGKAGDEPEVSLTQLEEAAALGRENLISWLKPITSKTAAQLIKLLDSQAGDAQRQVLSVAVENDKSLYERLLPYTGLLRQDLRELPIVLLAGSVIVTQTSARRDGGIEYTPRALADEVAQYALEPLVYSPGPQDTADAATWELRTSAELLDLKICDPAVGSGAILVAAGRFLADRLVEAWETESAEESIGSPEEVLVSARRAVADRCLYGVDRDPLAAEMAKLSLWLTTMSKDRPFTFLDHAIRVGDALLGVTNLEQVRWMHPNPEDGRKLHTTLTDFIKELEPLVQDALRRRKQLAEIRVLTIRDAQDKARLTAEADLDMEVLRAVADLVVAAAVSTALEKKNNLGSMLLIASEKVDLALVNGKGTVARMRALAELKELAAKWLNLAKPVDAPVRRCLHWPLEFPEVFVDREHPGFDVMVGNPPFVGGQKITGSMGDDVRTYVIAWLANGKKGSADLVAYFFLRATKLSRSFGFLATNTIAQGDTSEVGLAQIVDSGWTINRAVSSVRWPGRASLEISKVWSSSSSWRGGFNLDNVEVSGIDEMLAAPSRTGWRKKPLSANRSNSFIGSYVLGMGFTMPKEQALELIASDPRNADVLFPYLGGAELNQSPVQEGPRWIINFFDWSEEKARTYPDCYEIVEREVKPQRTRLKPNGDFVLRKPLPQLWWIYGEKRPKLYSSIAPLKRVLAVALTSKTLMPAFVSVADTRKVLGHSIVVFAYDDYFHFGVLSSHIHQRWVLRHASWMKTDPRYIPSDVFETYAQPAYSAAIEEAAEALDIHRSKLMVNANEGLTSTYNRYHNPAEKSQQIESLRKLHVSLDIAVRDAYGWSDLDLDHGFHEVPSQGIRFTFPPKVTEELLERLLELNKERYEAEAASSRHSPTKKLSKSKQPPAAEQYEISFGSTPDGEE
jgi:hypothetical protein